MSIGFIFLSLVHNRYTYLFTLPYNTISMKYKKYLLLNLIFFINSFLFAQDSKKNTDSLPQTITRLDSLLFDAYNNCNMELYASLFSEDLEFYHDKGGLSTSKKDMVDAVKNNICGKVRREIVPGTMEVSPIPGFGAIEMGKHLFHNLVEKSVSQPGNFIMVWKHENNSWKITRVISLH